MSRIEFSSLADRPEHKDLVARWLWSFWGAPGNFAFYRSMTEHCLKDDFPLVYVAFMDRRPVGTVALLGPTCSPGRTCTPGWPTCTCPRSTGAKA